MIYQWKTGAHIKTSAEIAGKMCAELSENGGLTAKRLLDANRPEDAPLHGEFEWNDGVAAERYRETQARHIINCICIKVEDREPVRQYYNISIADAEYKPIHVILQNKGDTDALCSTVLRELVAIKKKYRQIKEFASVWEAIEVLEVAR